MKHLRDPARALEQIRSVLKPGGVLLASTPFIVPYHPDPTDYWRFTEEAWTLMLSSWSRARVVRHGNQFQCLWYLAGMGYGQPLRLLDRVVFPLTRSIQPRNTFLGLLVTAAR
jgi:SAM-dependent methyltransferase